MRTPSVRAFIGLGSNQGNRRRNLGKACTALAVHPAIRVIKVSPVYESPPHGGPPQRDYLNAVVAIRTHLPPDDLLTACRQIELAGGRLRGGVRWGPRTIDLDILLYGTLVLRTRRLVIPHPRHPPSGKTIRVLLRQCRRPTE
jgi:2-amino-4-hydroxy-6-hydroxymethyldihydropteridine diphosphokinase